MSKGPRGGDVDTTSVSVSESDCPPQDGDLPPTLGQQGDAEGTADAQAPKAQLRHNCFTVPER